MYFHFDQGLLNSNIQFFYPQGTFGNVTGLQNASGCTPCVAGWYCPSKGLSLPFQKCTAGYWCISGSIEPAPTGKSYGVVCTSGSYCPRGTPAPVACPEGFYSNQTGKTKLNDCIGMLVLKFWKYKSRTNFLLVPLHFPILIPL